MEYDWMPKDFTVPINIKFMNKEGKTKWATVESADQTQAAIMEGSFFDGTMKKTGEMIDIKDMEKIMAPLPNRPPAIFGIALNHKGHAISIDLPFPEEPCLFLKAPQTIINPEEYIIIPRICQDEPDVDYEPEVAIIIGKDCKNVTPEEAWDYILGYTIVNDVTAQICLRTGPGGQWCFSKNFDNFTPMGPTMIKHSDYAKAGMPNIRLTSCLNDKQVQIGNSQELNHKFNQIISYLSQDMTLYEGTIILTGTTGSPGWSQNPRRVFMHGDHFSINATMFGTLHMHVKNSETNFQYRKRN